jgi:hypothetical protein
MAVRCSSGSSVGSPPSRLAAGMATRLLFGHPAIGRINSKSFYGFAFSRERKGCAASLSDIFGSIYISISAPKPIRPSL